MSDKSSLSLDLTNEGKELLMSSYDSSIQGLNMGFALATALAWNESIKKFLSTRIAKNNSPISYFKYAIVVTLMTGVVMYITETKLKKKNKTLKLT